MPNYLIPSDGPWLTLLVLSPIAGMLLVALAGALRLDDRLVADVAWAGDLHLGRFRPVGGGGRAGRGAVRRESSLGRCGQGRLLPRRGWHQPAAGCADRGDDANRDAGVVRCHTARQDPLRA